MINNADKKDNGKSYLEYANKFVDEYEKLFNDNNNVKAIHIINYYVQCQMIILFLERLLLILKCEINYPDLTTKKKTQITSSPNVSQMDTSSPGTSTSRSGIEVSSSETEPSDSDSVSPSSSILNKLILIPIIFVATLISLGIAYKVNNKSIKKYIQHRVILFVIWISETNPKTTFKRKDKKIKKKTDH
ncbi:putative bir1 protein [Plasmodium yoelii yoelii]|uniref:Bir1 protein n=1 Tax=Plasmodium yoelii yoelii TaxID=73239 RepID=Q7RQW1_PLAYO|nr:putative bir1 protein [Plasmodium yoelii yoelii]